MKCVKVAQAYGGRPESRWERWFEYDQSTYNSLKYYFSKTRQKIFLENPTIYMVLILRLLKMQVVL